MPGGIHGGFGGLHGFHRPVREKNRLAPSRAGDNFSARIDNVALASMLVDREFAVTLRHVAV